MPGVDSQNVSGTHRMPLAVREVQEKWIILTGGENLLQVFRVLGVSRLF